MLTSPKCKSTGLGACASFTRVGTPHRLKPESAHEATAAANPHRLTCVSYLRVSSTTAVSAPSSAPSALSPANVTPWRNPSCPGPSVVPAANEYPFAGELVRPGFPSIVNLPSTATPRPTGSHPCACLTAPAMFTTPEGEASPGATSASRATAACAAPVATQPATLSSPAGPSPTHLVTRPFPSSPEASPVTSSHGCDRSFTHLAPLTFGLMSPDALCGNATTAPWPWPTLPARVNPASIAALAAVLGASRARTSPSSPESNTAPLSFKEPNASISAETPRCASSPRSAFSASHDATPLLSPLTSSFVFRSEVPCTAYHATAPRTELTRSPYVSPSLLPLDPTLPLSVYVSRVSPTRNTVMVSSTPSFEPTHSSRRSV